MGGGHEQGVGVGVGAGVRNWGRERIGRLLLLLEVLLMQPPVVVVVVGVLHAKLHLQ